MIQASAKVVLQTIDLMLPNSVYSSLHPRPLIFLLLLAAHKVLKLAAEIPDSPHRQLLLQIRSTAIFLTLESPALNGRFENLSAPTAWQMNFWTVSLTLLSGLLPRMRLLSYTPPPMYFLSVRGFSPSHFVSCDFRTVGSHRHFLE